MTLTSPNRGWALERLGGDTGDMGWWSLTFGRLSERLNDLQISVDAASEIEGLGDAVSAARSDARRLGALLGAEVEEAALLRDVLRRYAEDFDTSAARANGMMAEIEDAHAIWAVRASEAENAGQAALWMSRSSSDDGLDAATTAAQEAIDERDAAKLVLDALWQDWERHYAAWDAAYDAALSALSGGGLAGAPLTSGARGFLDALLAAGEDPAEVARLWAQYSESEEGRLLLEELAEQRPEIIGNLDGVPYDVRAAANESRLAALLEAPDELSDEVRSALDSLFSEVDQQSGRLISFDPFGNAQVTAALLYGPLEGAGHISVLVPGMLSQVAEMGPWGTSARNLNAAVGSDAATVVWFGYDSPEIVEEPSMHRAEYGAAAFQGFLRGLDAASPDTETSVIAHSYGSTTAALAIGQSPDGWGVDKFITVGSAGLPNDETILANLQSSDAPRVYATMADNDFWAPVGQSTAFGHNTSPTSLDGVTEFDSDGGVDAGGDELAPTPGHAAHEGGNQPYHDEDEGNGYLMDGSESFYNVQEIVRTGEPGTESGGEGSVEGTMWDDIARIFTSAVR